MSDINDSTQSQLQEENKLIAQRLEKLDAIKARRNAYPNHLRRTHTADELLSQFNEQTKEELVGTNQAITVVGRVISRRGPFITIQDESNTVQAYLGKALQKTCEDWGLLDLGDIVGCVGILAKSGKGQLYCEIFKEEDFIILNKTLRPLPDQWSGLADQEVKYRQRYVDLIVSAETRNTFKIRSNIISQIRSFLTQRGFMEVETPMLQTIPGGATARPFETHHNAMDINMFLRIAPELYLKRLVVGGFEKVFEINRNFRNEGTSTRHNPEFTMLEWYQAYADYNDLMDTTEDMLRHLAVSVLGTTTITYADEEYDLSQPFERLSMLDSVLQYNSQFTKDDFATLEAAQKAAKSIGVEPKSTWGIGKLLTEVFEETVEEKLKGPIFITEYPAEVSPLARRNDNNSEITDRFEFFISGREIGNGFSELNDPIDQAERFKSQVAEKDAGDDEAMFYDEDYIHALEYGLPPTAGEGLGIDRLVMFFTNSQTIKDVILFPHMKPVAPKVAEEE
ncbi:MAG: lysine--tRNA ligase [Saccharospirillaceae bacterium]|nr:lysine--tRNA ligase [Pseudomonadales bacterium]NRB80655.1 lysine--tRNA ligase [Saccharospirillaceae bacterium]